MRYWIAWLKMFAVLFEISHSRFCVTLLFIGFVANKFEKRYCFWFSLPKYAFIITNEKGFPYRQEAFYFKYKHIHLCHVIGARLTDIVA